MMAQMEMKYVTVLIEAIAQNSAAMNMVNRIYEEHKDAIYPLVCDHPYYHHPLFDTAGLDFSFSCRRALGVYLYQQGDILPIIKKGWNTLTRFMRPNQVNMRSFFEKFVSDASLTDNEAMANAIVAAYLLHAHNDEEKSESLLVGIDEYADRQEARLHGVVSETKDTSHERTRAAELLRSIEHTVGFRIDSIGRIFQLLDERLIDPKIVRLINNYLRGAEMEGISPANIATPQITRSDVLDSLSLYVATLRPDLLTADGDTVSLDDIYSFLAPDLVIKLLCRAFRETKLAYISDSSEPQLKTIAELKDQVRELRKNASDMHHEAETNRRHAEKIREQMTRMAIQLEMSEKEKDSLQNQLTAERAELLALREFVFSLNDVEDIDAIHESPHIPTHFQVLICGGHENWRRRLRDRLPENFGFLPNSLLFDPVVLQTQDWLLLNVANMSHAHYERIMANVPSGTRIAYIAHTNIEQALLEISRILG